MEEQTTKQEYVCDFPGCDGGRSGHGTWKGPYVAHSEQGLKIHKYRKHDPEGNKLASEVARKMKQKQLSKWRRMTPKQKEQKMRYQRERRAKEKEKLGRTGPRTGPSESNRWDCPYCDFTSKGWGAKARHLKARHPNETGLVEFREKAMSTARKIDLMEPVPETTFHDRLIAAVVMAVADKIYNDIKEGRNNNQ